MRIKRVLAGALALTLCLALMTSTAFAAGTSKNEMVYGALNGDGSVGKIYVVNQLIGEYSDYGTYTEIKNLSTSSVPVINKDMITFPDEDVEGGLYYQGTMTGELPMKFDIGYTLDGHGVNAESLSGASGHLVLSIDASANTLCSETVRDGLMAQITVKMDTQAAANIIAPDATVVTVGKTATISYVVLPGESGSLKVEADIQDFHMDPIAITLLKGTLASSGINEKLDEFDDGFDDMLSGTNDMVDGTTELKDGMSSLSDGMGDLSDGMSKLSSGGKKLYSGMSEYGSNLQAYMSGVQSIVQPSADIQSGLAGLAENGTSLAQGISGISDNLSALSSSSGDLKTLAESLASSSDPNVSTLANGTLQTLSALEGLSGGLDSASNGLDEYIAGIQQTASGYVSFHNGLTGLADGGIQLGRAYEDILNNVSDFKGGVTSSASGAKKIYKSIKGLPDDVQKLIDGQLDFKDGIETAKDKLNETTSQFVADSDPPVSFASPDKNHPNSVQYILTTPSIEKKKTVVSEGQGEQTAQDDFASRFAALFN